MNTQVAWKPGIVHPKRASYRLRSLLPVLGLQEQGIACDFFDAPRLAEYDLVVFQKAYTDEDIEYAKTLRSMGKQVVFDLCDNLFHKLECQIAENDSRPLQDKLARLKAMIDLSHRVVVSTDTLRQLLIQAESVASEKLFVIGDAVEVPAERSQQKKSSDDSPHRLVWYGEAGLKTPPSGLVDLRRILPALEQVAIDFPIELAVISNDQPLFDDYFAELSFPLRYIEWDEETFFKEFPQQQICLIPVSRNPFTDCKSHNRVSLSLLLDVPVVADIIPAYEELRPYIFDSNWVANISKLLSTNCSKEMTRRGANFVRKHYSKQQIIDSWQSFLEAIS